MPFFTWHRQVMLAERYSTWMVPLRLVVGSRQTIQYRSGPVPISYLRGGQADTKPKTNVGSNSEKGET